MAKNRSTPRRSRSNRQRDAVSRRANSNAGNARRVAAVPNQPPADSDPAWIAWIKSHKSLCFILAGIIGLFAFLASVNETWELSDKIEAERNAPSAAEQAAQRAAEERAEAKRQSEERVQRRHKLAQEIGSRIAMVNPDNEPTTAVLMRILDQSYLSPEFEGRTLLSLVEEFEEQGGQRLSEYHKKTLFSPQPTKEDLKRALKLLSEAIEPELGEPLNSNSKPTHESEDDKLPG